MNRFPIKKANAGNEEAEAVTVEKTHSKRVHQDTSHTVFQDMEDDSLHPVLSEDDEQEVTPHTRSTRKSRFNLCGNIIDDVKQTIGKHWIQEMTNFNQKTIAVSFFLFFAAVAPAITFGAIYAKVTHNYIGAVEMLAATAWCGIFYALVGGMPIVSESHLNYCCRLQSSQRTLTIAS